MNSFTKPIVLFTRQLSFLHHAHNYFLLLCGLLLLQSCKKHDFNPPPVGAYDLKLVADGLTSPLVVTEPADGTNRLFIADQLGKVWILDANGNKMSTPFIDVSSMLPTNISPFYDER